MLAGKFKLLFVGILIVIALSIPAIFEHFKPGYFTNHDGEGHIIRFEEFHLALEDGHFPPRVSKNLMYGYGFYFFNFNYPFVHWLGEGFHLTGLDFTDSVKAVSVFALVGSGITMFLWQRSRWGFWGGLTAAVFYMYAPYKLMNMYVRGSLAENLAFVFIPLLFMFTEKIGEVQGSKRIRYIVLGGVSYAFLLLSHNITAFIFTFMLGLFILFQLIRTRDIKSIFSYALMGIIGLLLTTFFWFPSLAEKQYVRLDQTIGQDFPDHFVYPLQLVIPSWGYGGSGPGLDDGLSLQVGVFHLLAIAGAALLTFGLYKKKKIDGSLQFVFYLFVFVLSVFFMLEVSKPLWDHVPLFAFTQFPWRYLSWSIFVASVLAGGVVYAVGELLKQKNIAVYLSLATVSLLILSSWAYWLPNQRVDIKPLGDRPIPGSTTWADEQFPIWFEPKPTSAPEFRVETYPQAEVNILEWKTGSHMYEVSLDETTKFVENTAYYPGWTLYVNGEQTEFDYEDSEYPGRIVYTLEPGEYTVNTLFKETPQRLVADLISLSTLAIVIILLGRSYLKR